MNVEQQLQQAKQLCKNNQREQAKQLLLAAHQTDSTNLAVLSGLGRICERLHDDDTAQLYYFTYLTLDDKNHVIYRRMGDIYKRANQPTQAEDMYNKTLGLSPYDIECMVHFADLKEKNGKINEARALYQNAIQTSNNSNKSDANHAILFHLYGRLLLDQFNDAKGALNHLKKAAEIDPKYTNEYNRCQQSLKCSQESKLQKYTFHPSNAEFIKVIIYNFDDLIILNHEMYNLEQGDWSRDCDREMMVIFGRNDRIRRLRHHFEQLRKKNISFGLVSRLHPRLVHSLLQHIQLDTFVQIQSVFMHNRFEEIQTCYTLLKKENILYIYQNQNNLFNIGESCVIYQIKPLTNVSLTGLKLIDLQGIETIFGVPFQSQVFYNNYTFSIPDSMLHFNKTVYNAIKTETDINKRSRPKTVQELQVFKHICNDFNNDLREYKSCFQEFAWKYFDVSLAFYNDWWIAANYLVQLINMSPNDYELHQKYAQCLSYLKLNNAAKREYEIALSLNQNSRTTHELYANHLLYNKDNVSAFEHFDFCVACLEKESDMSDSYTYTNSVMKLLHGYARTAGFVPNQSEIADKYYQIILSRDNKRSADKTARYHCDYGMFLTKMNRLNEAQTQYERAIDLRPNNEYQYHKLSSVLFKMNKCEEHIVPLKQALQINPTFEPARRDYQRYFNTDYDCKNNNGQTQVRQSRNGNQINSEEKKEQISNRNWNHSSQSVSTYNRSAPSTTLSQFHPKNKYQNEFNRKYKDFMNGEKKCDKDRFKRILIQMSLKELNDIRVVLNNSISKLRQSFRAQIKDIDSKDLKKIMKLFQEIKAENEQFDAWLTGNDIDTQTKTQIFSNNGIYTMDALKCIQSEEDFRNTLENRASVNERVLETVWQMIQQIHHNM